MIALAAPQFSLSGALVLTADAKSRVADRSRRVSRTATLDGGVTILDRGYTHGDRTFSIVGTGISRADVDAVAALLEDWSLLVVSTREGCFLGAPSTLTYDGEGMTLQILISSCLSEG